MRGGIVSGAVLAAAVVVCAGCASDTGSSSDRIVLQDPDTRAEIAFSAADRERIRDYYGSNLPPGLAKGQRLPHGLPRQLERGGRVPSGLEGRELPPALTRELEPLPEGYTRLRIGADVAVIERDTRLVVDVVHDAGLADPYNIDLSQ